MPWMSCAPTPTTQTLRRRHATPNLRITTRPRCPKRYSFSTRIQNWGRGATGRRQTPIFTIIWERRASPSKMKRRTGRPTQTIQKTIPSCDTWYRAARMSIPSTRACQREKIISSDKLIFKIWKRSSRRAKRITGPPVSPMWSRNSIHGNTKNSKDCKPRQRLRIIRDCKSSLRSMRAKPLRYFHRETTLRAKPKASILRSWCVDQLRRAI